MGGHGKGKKKKNKGKSNNARKSENKQHGTLRATHDLGQQNIDDSGGSEESGISLSPTSWSNNRMLEEILMEKIELLYKKAEEKLLELGNGIDETRKAILMNGSVLGGPHILSNIIENALAMIKKGHITIDKIDVEPIFEDVHELARFSMESLINMIVEDQPNMMKVDAILCLLQSNSLAVQGSSVDSSHSKDDKDLGHENDSEIYIGKLLKEKTRNLQRLPISPTTPSSPSAQQNVATQIHYPHFMTGESLSSDIESSSLDVLKSILNCPDEISVEEWLRTCSEDSNDNMILNLTKQVENLTTQVKERREWAKKIVIQTAKRFIATRAELRDLRLDKNERDRLLVKRKEELHHYSSFLEERENNLRKVKSNLDGGNQVIKRLEAKNHEIKAEIFAYDLTKSETEKSILEAQKRERLSLKKCNDTEKKVGDLKRQIAEENQKLAETGQRMQQVIEAQEQAKLRLKQEEKAKAQAHALLLEEKKLNRLEKENSKSRLASVRQELDMKYRRMMDDQNRLQLELSQLKAAQYSSTASSSFVVADSGIQSRRHPRLRLCIICRKNDVSILFLPCAHQVICYDCDKEVYEALEECCPICKRRIEKRVKVYGPSS